MTAVRCHAKRKSDGQQCSNFAVHGYEVCRLHGANPNNHGGNPNAMENLEKLNSPEALAARSEAMKKNALGWVHGLRTSRLLTEGEVEIYQAARDGLLSDFPDMDNGTDEMLVDAIAFYCAKLYCAQLASKLEATDRIIARIATLQAQLGIRRDIRKGMLPGPSPQEWAFSLVAKFRARQASSGDAGGAVDTADSLSAEKEPT